MIYTLLKAASGLSGTLMYRNDGCTRMGVGKKLMLSFGFEQRLFSIYSISITQYRVGCYYYLACRGVTREMPHSLRCISFAEVDKRRRCHIWLLRERRQQNEAVASAVLSCVIAVGLSFVHQYKLLTVAKNGRGSALSEC